MRSKANVFSCPPGCNILSSFVQALHQGKILPNEQLSDLSKLEILVPTKRAARSLKSEFLRHANSAMLLPKISPLADIDSLSLFFMPGAGTGAGAGAEQFKRANQPGINQPVISHSARILLLAQLVRKWQISMGSPGSPGSPGNMGSTGELGEANSIWLAYELASLIDEAALHNLDWRKLEALGQEFSANLSEWWLLSYDFLKIATEQWPQILLARGELDIGQANWQRFYHKAQAVKQGQASIIALGSSGAVPCVAMLLEAIAFSENGAIVLPGLDRDLQDDVWQSLGNYSHDTTLYSQPQLHYYRLLNKLKISRKEVQHIGHIEPPLRAREFYMAKAMQPATAAQEWAELERADLTPAFAQLTLIEAMSEQEEAAAIAVALRLAVQTKGTTAALVTSDRKLARRVTNELARFGIVANDSGQQNLLQLAPMQLMQLILQSCASNDVHVLLSILKHSLTRLGYEKNILHNLVENYELYRLRGAVLRFSILDLKPIEEQMQIQWLNQDHNHNQHNIDYNEDIHQSLTSLIERIVTAVAPLKAVFSAQLIGLAEACEALVACLENFCRAADGSIDQLYEGAAGRAIIHFFQEIADSGVEYAFAGKDFTQVFTALAANVNVEPDPSQSNIYIWGMLESRLQYVDMMVIGGLNEGSLPKLPKTSPFISRMMKIKLGLEPPEVAIGASGLDLQMLLGMPKLVLSRSLSCEGEAQVASRWLQRLQTLAGPELSAEFVQRGQEYMQLAKALNEAPAVAATPRPAPTPPIALRPTSFTISEVAMLQSDPYSIYARKILRLRPLDPLVHEADAREKGTLYHEILANYVAGAQEDGQLRIVADQSFASLALPPDIELAWRCLFDKAAISYLEFESKRKALKSYIEQDSQPVAIGCLGARLRGRADRIDIFQHEDGSVVADIIDYKTGNPPSLNSIVDLKDMQLILEAGLLMRGGFALDYKCELRDLIYIKIHPIEFKLTSVMSTKNVQLLPLVAAGWVHCGKLIDAYQQLNQAYISYTSMPQFYDDKAPDFHHLSRYEEWAR